MGLTTFYFIAEWALAELGEIRLKLLNKSHLKYMAFLYPLRSSGVQDYVLLTESFLKGVPALQLSQTYL